MRTEEVVIAESDEEAKWLRKNGLEALPHMRDGIRAFIVPAPRVASEIVQKYQEKK